MTVLLNSNCQPLKEHEFVNSKSPVVWFNLYSSMKSGNCSIDYLPHWPHHLPFCCDVHTAKLASLAQYHAHMKVLGWTIKHQCVNVPDKCRKFELYFVDQENRRCTLFIAWCITQVGQITLSRTNSPFFGPTTDWVHILTGWLFGIRFGRLIQVLPWVLLDRPVTD